MKLFFFFFSLHLALYHETAPFSNDLEPKSIVLIMRQMFVCETNSYDYLGLD